MFGAGICSSNSPPRHLAQRRLQVVIQRVFLALVKVHHNRRGIQLVPGDVFFPLFDEHAKGFDSVIQTAFEIMFPDFPGFKMVVYDKPELNGNDNEEEYFCFHRQFEVPKTKVFEEPLE